MMNLDDLLALLNEQSEDLSLWEDPHTERESALQDALRIIHHAIEQTAGLTDGLDS